MCLKLDQVGSPSLSFKASEKLGCASKKLQNDFTFFLICLLQIIEFQSVCPALPE